MKLLETEKGRKIVEQVTLKNVKLNIGHDLAGMYADFYLNKKKMGYFSDDGCGGETDVVYISAAHQKEFESFLVKNNFAQLMFENDWGFMECVKKINLHCQAENIINEAVNLNSTKKFEKKIAKECLKAIIVGTTSGYRGFGFRVPLKQLVTLYKDAGLKLVQDAYDKAKREMKEGEKIFNENLEELGVKL